jgi:hypothetical protein
VNLQQAAEHGCAVPRPRRRVVRHQQVVNVVQDHQPLLLLRLLLLLLVAPAARRRCIARAGAADRLQVRNKRRLRAARRGIPLRPPALACPDAGAGTDAALQLAEDRGQDLAELGGARAAQIGVRAPLCDGPALPLWVAAGRPQGLSGSRALFVLERAALDHCAYACGE